MKPQDAIKAKLGKLGIPFKHIDCYGNQIVVTTWSESAAKKFAGVIVNFAKIRGVNPLTPTRPTKTRQCVRPAIRSGACLPLSNPPQKG